MTDGETVTHDLMGTAFELRPGATYAIELQRNMSFEELQTVGESFARAKEETGCKFILLTPDMRLMRDPEAA